MRSIVIFAPTALLTFLLGISFVGGFSPARTDTTGDHGAFIQPLAEENVPAPLTVAKGPPFENAEGPAFKYGCRDVELVAFWEHLDKEQFLRQKQAYYRELQREHGRHFFSAEAKGLRQNFNCSYFTGVEYDDLNGDGIEELRVGGPFIHRDAEEFVFERSDRGLRMILADIYNIEFELRETTSHGFRDIVYSSNWSGGTRSIKHYKFDGRVYRQYKCYGQTNKIERNAQEERLILSETWPESCDPRNAVTH